MRITIVSILLLALAQISLSASSQILPRGYVCHKTNEKIKVDGKLNEAAWKNAPWMEDYVDIRGFHRPKALYQTRSRMLWDDKYLYIGAYLEEPYVWATLTKHDSVIYMENAFELFIDPDCDNHNYYEIEINALNTTWDLTMNRPYRDNGGNDGTFEFLGIKHAVHVYGKLNDFKEKDKGWSVEFAIPWKALAVYANRPTPPHEGDQWRVNFMRVEWPITMNAAKSDRIGNLPIGKIKGVQESFWLWNPIGAVDTHRPEKWGLVQFTDKKPNTVRFKLNPDYDIQTQLMRIYYAEKSFFRNNQNWTQSLDELGIKLDNRYADDLRIELTDNGFKASIHSVSKPGMKWCVREDSKLWSEK